MVNWFHARNQKFFKAEEVSWNQDTLTNICVKNTIKKALQGKILEFFSQILLELRYEWKI